MRLARRALIIVLTLLVLCAVASAQTLRPADDPRNTAPTVGTGGSPGGPTGLFTIYDGQTLRKGEFTFSLGYSNYDRDPGNVDITEVPVSFQVGLNDHLEVFFNTDAYRGVKVNNPQNLSSFYLPNSQLYAGSNRLVSGGILVITPLEAQARGFGAGPIARLQGGPFFVQFPFVGGPANGFGFNRSAIPFTATLGPASGGGNGNFGTAANFPGIGSVFGSILPGIVLTTRVVPATSTTLAQTVPATFTLQPSYLPDAPFINRLYGESSFSTFTVGAKWRFTGPNNPLGVGIVPFYRFYVDKANDLKGFNQLQRGASPGGNIGDFGVVGFVDGRLSKHANVSANVGYIINSNPRSNAFGGNKVTLLDRPNEVVAGIGIDFPINQHFQPIFELKSDQYVAKHTPNAFPNNPIDVLGGIRIFPARWWGISAAYRAHMNQQGDRLFNNTTAADFPAGFVRSKDPHGYLFQVFAGHRNAREPTVLPNNPPTVTLASNTATVTLAANCGEGQIPASDCTATSTQVQLTANASDPDGDTLLYTWSTTGGRVTGDGPNVTWDLSGVTPGTYTANVEVDDGCGCVSYASTTVTVNSCGCQPAPTPVPTPEATPVPTPEATPVPATSSKFDEYGNIARNDVKARLDNFAVALQNAPGSQGYIISYGGRRGRAGEGQARADFAKDYLVNSRGIDAGRLVTVDGGFREDAATELWIVPTGATPPTASPTVDASQVQTTRGRTPRRHGTHRRRGHDDDEE